MRFYSSSITRDKKQALESRKYRLRILVILFGLMGIYSGQKIQVLTYQNRIELIPLKSMKEMKGFLKDMDTDIQRDPDRV